MVVSGARFASLSLIAQGNPRHRRRPTMRMKTICSRFALVFALVGIVGANAADYPKPQDGDWIVNNYRFHNGEILPELRLHYMTIGAPSGEPVLVLHGSSASGQTMLTDQFAGELFGPGQPLDVAR